MNGSREFVAQIVARGGLVPLLSACYSSVVCDIRVLAYHRVLPRLDENRFAYDIELVSAWQDEFNWQVGYLARNYEVITCRDLATMIDTSTSLPRKAAIITFDDGYRDNHDIVLPILRSHEVGAVCFVATGYAGQNRTYWYDRLVHQVLRTNVKCLSLGPQRGAIELGEGLAARRQACRAALLHLKSLDNEARVSLIDKWDAVLGVDQNRAPGSLDGPMSWAQIAALSAGGVEIGSHTVTHPVLSKIANPRELEFELRESKSAIQHHVGEPVLSLAYPVGGSSAHNTQVREAAAAAGYRFAFTYYRSGRNDPGTWDSYRIGRMAVERDTSRERFRAMLAAPPLFAFS